MGSSYLIDCITDWRKKIGRKRENKKKTICVKNEDLIMFFQPAVSLAVKRLRAIGYTPQLLVKSLTVTYKLMYESLKKTVFLLIFGQQS